MKRFIKKLIQKLRRGFSDEDLWNLDITIARFIYPRLYCFLKSQRKSIWTPCDLTHEEWLKILSAMCRAFKIIIMESTGDIYITQKEFKMVQKGLDLFAKYFTYLWS